MLVRIRAPRQKAVGAVVLVGPVGGAAVVLLTGRGAVVLVRAGLDVAAVVFRHLPDRAGGEKNSVLSFTAHICAIIRGSHARRGHRSTSACRGGRRADNRFIFILFAV